MAMQTDNTLITNREMLGELIAAPFRAFGRAMVYLAENNSRTLELRKAAQMSDEVLAKKGITRTEAIYMAAPHDV